MRGDCYHIWAVGDVHPAECLHSVAQQQPALGVHGCCNFSNGLKCPDFVVHEHDGEQSAFFIPIPQRERFYEGTRYTYRKNVTMARMHTIQNRRMLGRSSAYR